MNTYLDIILSCVLQQAGQRRIVFSCFDPDICTMWVRVDASANANAPFFSRESISNNSIATVHECHVIELGIHSVSLEVPNHSLIFVFPGFPQGASEAEQISHPLPDPGNFWNVSRADGHPLPDHPNRHKFCPEWEYSGELCCVKIPEYVSLEENCWNLKCAVCSSGETVCSSRWCWWQKTMFGADGCQSSAI